MRLRSALMMAALAALVASVLAQGPRRDGNWEVKMEMSMPGMPAMPPITTTQCITKEDALDPQKSLQQGPSGRGGNQNCKVSEYKVEGSKVTYAMSCEAPEKMSGTGEFVYAGDTYTGTMTVNAAGGGMSMKFSGKRLGDCTK